MVEDDKGRERDTVWEMEITRITKYAQGLHGGRVGICCT